MARLLSKQTSIFSFGSTGRMYDILYEAPWIAKEMLKKRINLKSIMHTKYKEHKLAKIKGAKIKFLDIKSEATTSIFGDYVSIHLIKDKPIIILIKNKHIAKTYKNHFNFLWKQAKP